MSRRRILLISVMLIQLLCVAQFEGAFLAQAKAAHLGASQSVYCLSLNSLGMAEGGMLLRQTPGQRIQNMRCAHDDTGIHVSYAPCSMPTYITLNKIAAEETNLLVSLATFYRLVDAARMNTRAPPAHIAQEQKQIAGL